MLCFVLLGCNWALTAAALLNRQLAKALLPCGQSSSIWLNMCLLAAFEEQQTSASPCYCHVACRSKLSVRPRRATTPACTRRSVVPAVCTAPPLAGCYAACTEASRAMPAPRRHQESVHTNCVESSIKASKHHLNGVQHAALKDRSKSTI